jgi:hypothetical protein
MLCHSEYRVANLFMRIDRHGKISVCAIVFEKMSRDGYRPGGELNIPCPIAVTAVTADVGYFAALPQGFEKFCEGGGNYPF